MSTLFKQTIKAVQVGAIATIASLSIVGPVVRPVAAQNQAIPTSTEGIRENAQEPVRQLAQTDQSAPRHLTVTGEGRAFAPVKEAALVFSLNSC